MELMPSIAIAVGSITLLTGLIIYYLEQKEKRPAEGKPTALKKEEIIDGYKKEMRDLLSTYQDDNSVCLQEKTRMLQRINSELSTNIFFDQDEVRSLLTMLAGLKSS